MARKMTKTEIGRLVARNPNHPWRLDYQRAHDRTIARQARASAKAMAKG